MYINVRGIHTTRALLGTFAVRKIIKKIERQYLTRDGIVLGIVETAKADINEHRARTCGCWHNFEIM